MAQRVPLQLSSGIAQTALPLTQRGQSDNTSQLQLKLIQKNGSTATVSPLRSDHQDAGVANIFNERGVNVTNAAQPSSSHKPASSTGMESAGNQMSIHIDDSMLLNLLKQIVDSEFSKSRSSVVSHDNSVQDAEIQIERDAVFGVLRSALDVAQQTTQDQVEVQSTVALKEQSRLDTNTDSVQAADLAPRDAPKQPFTILIQEASRLASVVTRMSPSSMKRTNFLMQNWLRVEMNNSPSIIWRLVEHYQKTVQPNPRSSTDVVRSPILVSIQEKEYGTAPLWYQQDMENGPPRSPISSTQRT